MLILLPRSLLDFVGFSIGCYGPRPDLQIQLDLDDSGVAFTNVFVQSFDPQSQCPISGLPRSKGAGNSGALCRQHDTD